MKVLFGCLLFVFMSASGYACWAPNCYGAVGFDPETGQTSAFTDYPSEHKAAEMLKADCPTCTYLTFGNACGAVVHSARHNITETYYGGSDRDLKSHALTQCEKIINDRSLEKNRNDKRRSKYRGSESSDCKVTVLACTLRAY